MIFFGFLRGSSFFAICNSQQALPFSHPISQSTPVCLIKPKSPGRKKEIRNMLQDPCVCKIMTPLNREGHKTRILRAGALSEAEER